MGLKNAKDILAKYRTLQFVKGGQGRSVAERKAEFRKVTAKLTEIVSYRDIPYFSFTDVV